VYEVYVTRPETFWFEADRKETRTADTQAHRLRVKEVKVKVKVKSQSQKKGREIEEAEGVWSQSL
jgi:hypothetical protein